MIQYLFFFFCWDSLVICLKEHKNSVVFFVFRYFLMTEKGVMTKVTNFIQSFSKNLVND